jgi:hypothetical protein
MFLNNQIFIFLAIYFISEFFGHWVFLFLRRKFVNRGFEVMPFLLGVVERFFLHISLLNGIPQSLIFFGALKIGTRIKTDENKISNDYFLLGNLISVGLVIIVISIWNFINIK